MKRKLTISMEDVVVERMDAYCERIGLSRSALITYLVATSLDTTDRLITGIKTAAVKEKQE